MTKREQLKRIFRKIASKELSTPELADKFYELKDRVDHYKAPLIKVAIEGASPTLIKGKDGKDGKPGRDGKNGTDGKKGERGDKGDTGKGKDGRDGVDGMNGRDGQDGTNGKDGEKGDPGQPGIPGKDGKDGQDAEEVDLIKLRTEVLQRIDRGGGSANRKETFGGTDYLTKYTDINWKAGTNVTLTVANNDTTKMVDVTVAASGGGTVRSINSVSINTNAGATAGTDYVYLCSGTITITLPTAVANQNLYTIKNVGTGVITIATTGGQTIDGATTQVMPVQFTAVDLISDSANWNIT